MPVSSLELAKVAAMAADSKKAADILLLDLTGQTDVCDYFLICSGANGHMVDAIVDEIREKVRKNCEISAMATEGRDGLRWVLVDFGSVRGACLPTRDEGLLPSGEALGRRSARDARP